MTNYSDIPEPYISEFREHLRDNPWLVKAVFLEASKLYKAGEKRIGVKYIFEQVRRNTKREISNSWTPYYARLLIHKVPKLRKYIQLKPMRFPRTNIIQEQTPGAHGSSQLGLLATCALFFLFVGCSPVVPTTPPAQVFAGEYVVESQTVNASGQWCPWRAGFCPVTPGTPGAAHLPAGLYQVEHSGKVTLLKEDKIFAQSITDYEPESDLCKTELKDTICSPNFVHRVSAQPADPLYPQLWGMEAIKAAKGWDVRTDAGEVVVGVVDTGISEHEDLNIIGGYNAISDDANYQDDHGHGSHVSGTICGRSNGVGVVGVSWGCDLLALKFLNSKGSGSTFDAIKAIDWATNYAQTTGKRIILNNSWGGGGYSEPLRAAIQRADDAGILFVVAAGNAARDCDKQDCYPANYEVENVISVASVRQDGKLSSFSNYGSKSVDIAAPGSDIISTYPGNKYAKMSGTSMAAPHVTGALALLLAQGIDPTEALDRLSATVSKSSNLSQKIGSGGVLNLEQALTGKYCNQQKLEECFQGCKEFNCKCNKKRKCRKGCRNYWCS